MKDKITIIVPVYNTENYLEDCLNSLMSQTYTNIEILLVNDGSQDNSLNICKEYATKDKRIKVIDKKHSGVSDTRNTGIKKSTGKYLTFIDSDDIIEKDYIERLYNTIKDTNSDVVVSGYSIIEKHLSKDIKYINETKIFKYKDIEKDLINTHYFSSICTNLYKKELIENIEFDQHLRFVEDWLFSYYSLKKAKIVYLPYCGYKYLQHKSSTTHNYTYENMKEYVLNNKYVLEKIKTKKNNDLINNRMFTKINYALNKLCLNKKIKSKDIKKIYIEFMDLVNYKDLDLSNISYESKLNKIRLYLLYKKHLHTYMFLNRMVGFIKR